jgi:hypothetical protein
VPPEDVSDLLAIQDEIAASDEGRLALEQVLYDEAVQFILAAAETARQLRKLDNVWQARRIMADALIWIHETRRRVNQELAVKERPTQTHEAFKR